MTDTKGLILPMVFYKGPSMIEFFPDRQTVEPQVRKEAIVPIKLILIFAILSVGIIAAGCITYSGYKKHYRAEVEHELTVIADLKVAQLVRWIGDCKGDAELIFNNTPFSNLARRYIRDPQDSVAEQQLRGWLDEYLTGHDYDQVRLLDTQGVTRMSSPAGQPPASAAVTDRLAEVLRSGRITIVDFYRGDHVQRPYLSILIPIRDISAGKRVIGTISLRVDPERYLYPFILSWPTPSRTAETLLVRRDGNDVLFLVDLRFRKDAALNLRVPLNKTDRPPVMAVLGRTGIVEGVDYRGEPVIADIRPVPGSPWFLVTRKNTSEVYGQARGQLWMIVGLVTALLFGSGTGLALVWRQQAIAFYKEREKAEAAQRLLSSIVESSDDAIISKDLGGTILSWNVGAQKIYGYSADEVVGKSLSLLVPPDMADEIPEIMERLKKGEAIKHYETERIRKDGGRIFVSITLSPIRDDAGKIFGASTITRDITERRRMEEERQKISEEIQDLYNNAPCGYHSLDADGVFVRVNDTELSWLGYSREEILEKKRFTDIITEKSLEIFKENFPGFKERGWVYGLEFEMVRKDGTIMPVSLSATAVKDSAGNFIMSRSTIYDITERKKSEEEIMKLNKDLQRSLEELEVAYEDMESFSYSVSHDLRAPLRIIGGMSEILLKNYYDTLDDKGKNFLKLILENIKRMDQLILALLDLSKVGRKELKIVEIDMENAATLIAGDLKAMAPERNITVTVGKLPSAHGDLALIRQVFANLLSNAIKFTKGRDVAHIEVGDRCEESENIYYVKDNGAGFNPELEDKLFKVFQRLHSAQEFEGIGIGLSIVYRIISRHNGRVWAEGRPDEGATFYFSLPRGKA